MFIKLQVDIEYSSDSIRLNGPNGIVEASKVIIAVPLQTLKKIEFCPPLLEIIGVTHVAALKWESGVNQISPPTDLCIRFYILQKLKAKNDECGKLYHEISPERLSQQPLEKKQHLLKIESFV